MGTPHGPRQLWNSRYHAACPPKGPATFLTQRAGLLPASGRALDLAGGGGRNAIWLAQRGLQVTLVDASDEACAIARHRAAKAAVEIDVQRLELAADPLPTGCYDIVLAHRYLDPDVWRDAAGRLAVGGLLLLCQPTVVNQQRHARPTRQWLLAEGQMREFVDNLAHVEVVELTEGWADEGRHEARAVLRRVPADR